jgi:pectate lyase
MHLPCPKGAATRGIDHDGDLIHIEGSASNIWIDHCELSAQFDGVEKDKYDGLIDVKKGPGNITISWNYIHDAHKVSLVGHSDKDESGPWRLSIHHNIFNNLGSRIPSLRGGKAAIFNNYYVKIKYTAINSRLGAEVYCEKNYFEGVGRGKIVKKAANLGEGPIGTYYSVKAGTYNAVDNFYTGCKGNQPTEANSTTSYKPPFMNGNNTIIPAKDVPKVLLEYAGVGGRKKTLKYPEGEPTRIIHSPPLRVVEKQNNAHTAVYNIRGIKIHGPGTVIRSISNGVYIAEVNGTWVTRLNTTRK